MPCSDGLASNAEAMGGFAVRSDAISGAVECQKGLHDIAKLVQEGFASAQELKHFISSMCCESYPDFAQYEAAIAGVEDSRPKFSKRCSAEADGQTRKDDDDLRQVGHARTAVGSCEHGPHTGLRA